MVSSGFLESTLVPEPDHLVVSEVFGPTFQGEGPSTGRRAAFVRLGRCNLACSWCDTPYTWRWEDHDPAVELTSTPIADLAAAVAAIDAALLVVTGGEPLLQQRELVPLLQAVRIGGMAVEIETAGTLAAAPELVTLVDHFNVSPKLASSGNPLERRRKPDVLRAFQATGKASFKFVATGPVDLEEIAAIVDECELTDVWVMPEGTTAEAVIAGMKELAGPVLARGWHLSTRLHVLLWGDRRGV